MNGLTPVDAEIPLCASGRFGHRSPPGSLSLLPDEQKSISIKRLTLNLQT